MRKSLPPEHPPLGNGAKFLCYREAWTRIEEALQQGFFLEAVAIEESIIWDRITSYLHDHGKTVPSRESFHNVIKLWQKEQCDDSCDLQEGVSAWRSQRNNTIHGMIKSENIDVFLEEAKATAERGKDLARMVECWRKEQKRHS